MASPLKNPAKDQLQKAAAGDMTLHKSVARTSGQSTFAWLDIDRIVPDPNQPRRIAWSDPSQAALPAVAAADTEDSEISIDEHADSDVFQSLPSLAWDILRHGVLQSISVRLATVDGKPVYMLISGERRLQASRIARYWAAHRSSELARLGVVLRDGYDFGKIPAIIVGAEQDSLTIFEQQFSENIFREDMTDEDKARAYRVLIDGRFEGNVSRFVRLFAPAVGDQGKVQRVLDRVEYAHVVHMLKGLGVGNEDVIGRLCTSERKREKRGGPNVLEAFVNAWNAELAAGRTPAPKQIWDRVSPNTKKTHADEQPSADELAAVVGQTAEQGAASDGDSSDSSDFDAGADDFADGADLEAMIDEATTVSDEALARTTGVAQVDLPQPVTKPRPKQPLGARDEFTLEAGTVQTTRAVALLHKLGLSEATEHNAPLLLTELLFGDRTF